MTNIKIVPLYTIAAQYSVIKFGKMASTKLFDFQELNETVDEIVQDLVCKLCQRFPKPGQPRWYKSAIRTRRYVA